MIYPELLAFVFCLSRECRDRVLSADCIYSSTKPGDFLLVAVPKDKTAVQCVAQITKKTPEGDWGVYLKDVGEGKWKWPHKATEFFIPQTDIQRVFREEDYTMKMEHRAVIYTFT
ncbi:uncharacterized protein [Littorina saxatilis]|uniref:uncharacterized protein n=1 Tax=Littorina saxatilis TaxID=31220 RepID=UPI0038B66639